MVACPAEAEIGWRKGRHKSSTFPCHCWLDRLDTAASVKATTKDANYGCSWLEDLPGVSSAFLCSGNQSRYGYRQCTLLKPHFRRGQQAKVASLLSHPTCICVIFSLGLLLLGMHVVQLLCGCRELRLLVLVITTISLVCPPCL